MKKKNRLSPKSPLNPSAAETGDPVDPKLTAWEERRRIKLAIQRKTMRRIRNFLILLAVLAGLWFLYLCYVNR